MQKEKNKKGRVSAYFINMQINLSCFGYTVGFCEDVNVYKILLTKLTSTRDPIE